eukprot:TRINITY_DN3600_c2_g1_i1.p1 TRINITY_DN3600_c2_g1~~TRINITY_DN3600_c2_g1_i1.p1  ORF type:complete len:565 (+),score=132.90 TRINITY_DN3600_c2_g1_i1:2329-4023(+)
MTTFCPPMNRLFFKPRQDTIDGICNNYLMRKKKPQRVESKNTLSPTTQQSLLERKKSSLLDIGGGDVFFLPESQQYTPVNALVLMIASYLVYNIDDITLMKDLLNEFLGFEKDRIEIIKDKSSDTYILVAIDKEKLIISCRGTPNQQEAREMLEVPKKGKVSIKKHDFWLQGETTYQISRGIRKIWNDLDELLSNWHTSQAVFLTGHDTGGSFAVVLGHALTHRNYDVSGIYTFGSPKSGDTSWASTYPQWLYSRTYRITHFADFMVTIPAKEHEFVHVGNEVPVGDVADSTARTLDPHKLESYFTCLLPQYMKAVGRDEKNDKLLARSSKILLDINKRESIMFLTPEQIMAQGSIDDSPSSSSTSTSSPVKEQNKQPNIRASTMGISQNEKYNNYVVAPKSNLVRGAPVVNQPPVGRGAPGRGTGRGISVRGPPPSSGPSLVAPNILSQIRNSLFVVLDSAKSCYEMIVEEKEGNFEEKMNQYQKPLANLKILAGLIRSQNPLVKNLEMKLLELNQKGNVYFDLCTAYTNYQAEPHEIQQSFETIKPLFKEVVSACSQVSGSS